MSQDEAVPPAASPATLSLIDGVEGWLTEAQAARLWTEAARVRAGGRITEIGSFRGRSTIIIACAAAEGVEIVAIDPHGGADRGPQEIAPDAARGEQDFVHFHDNLRRAGVEHRVHHLRATSKDALGAVNGKVELLYIDGAHRYLPAREDIERWGGRVSIGGTMMLHDAFNAIGVTLAQLRLLLLSSRWRYRGRCGSLAEYRRERLGPGSIAINALRQMLGLAYFGRNLLIKVLIVARIGPLARFLGLREAEWPY